MKNDPIQGILFDRKQKIEFIEAPKTGKERLSLMISSLGYSAKSFTRSRDRK